MVAVTVATPQSRRIGRRAKRIANRIAFALAVFVIVSPAILVFLWMLSLSFKPEIENIAYPPVFIPEHPTLANFERVFEASPFGHYLVNSLIVTGSATLLAIMVGVPAGYGIAKAKAYRLAVLVLIARITPNLSYLIPLFILFQMLGLTGTLWQAFRHIALPLSRPGIVVAAILAFIFSWNNFIFGVVLAGRETRTLPVAVYNVLTFEQISWGPLAAAALLVTLPVLILTVIIQREIVGGLAAGGVKGG